MPALRVALVSCLTICAAQAIAQVPPQDVTPMMIANARLRMTCGEIGYLQFGEETDGRIYYYDVKTRKVIGACGGYCARNADECRGRCPPPEWSAQGCQARFEKYRAAITDPDVRAGGLLYLHSVGLPKEARVCDQRVPGYLATFAPAFEKWRERHKELIAIGYAAMQEDAATLGRTVDSIAEELTDELIKKMPSIKPEIIAEMCQNRLAALEQTVTPKGPRK